MGLRINLKFSNHKLSDSKSCPTLPPLLNGKYILDESNRQEDDGGEGGDDDPSWWDEDSYLMAIDLGYDEGGSGDTLLVSAQVGITDQAKKFKKEWKRRLVDANDLPYFHSVDFDNYTGGVFTKAGLNRNERGELLGDLCDFVHDRLLFSVTARVSISEFNSLSDQVTRSRHGTAYGFAINMCMLTAYILVKKLSLQPHFNILVEAGHRNSNQVAQILEGLRRFLPEIAANRADVIPDIRVLSAGLGSKKDHPILQAADMVAYSRWLHMCGGDHTIWNALRKEPRRYQNGYFECNRALIEMWVGEGKASYIKRQRKRGQKSETEQRIPEIRFDNDGTIESPSQRDKEKNGSGESGKTEEESREKEK